MEGKFQFVGKDLEWFLHVFVDLYTPKSRKINLLKSYYDVG